MAGLAEEILNGIVAPVVTVADEGMHGGISDPMIIAVGIGASLAPRVNRLLAERTPPAFSLRVRHD